MKKKNTEPREKYYFINTIFHCIEEISKEKFFEMVAKDINAYDIRKEGNYYYVYDIEAEDDIYACKDVDQNIMNQWLIEHGKSLS